MTTITLPIPSRRRTPRQVATTIPGFIADIPECGETVAISPYVGCDLRCSYCITGSQGASTPRATAVTIRRALEATIADRPRTTRFIVGGISDAYPSVDARFGLARICVEELTRCGAHFGVVTKSPLVTRDVDLLGASPTAHVTMSLCSVDDGHLARLDLGAHGHRARIDALRLVAEHGVATCVSIAPWIPEVTDVGAIVRTVRATVGPGVWFVVNALNVRAALVASRPRWRGYDQAAVNTAYGAARAAYGDRPGVAWLDPPPLTGHHANACTFH